MRYNQTHVFLKEDLTIRLVMDKFETFEKLEDAWEEAYKVIIKTKPHFSKPKKSQTLERWMTEGVPIKTSNYEMLYKRELDAQLFAFCSLLDVDALAIFDYEKNGYFSSFAKIRQLIYFGSRALGAFAPILQMYGPAEEWPSNDIARIYYDRPWFTDEFSNESNWKSSNYILVKAKFIEPIRSNPRAVHIAYRRVGVPDIMWRYYGTVLSIDGVLHLYNESGGYLHMDQTENDEIRFRTYFGGREVVWRVASLHEFELKKIHPFNDESTIGFKW
jgi:hypothetical protein